MSDIFLYSQSDYIIKNKLLTKNQFFMKKYVCQVCGWESDPAVGDPDNGIAPGTSFESLPEDFVCPVCGAGKDEFEPA